MANKFVHDKANFSHEKIVYFSSLKDSIKNIKNNLKMEQKKMFKQTCFGNFLNMGGNRLTFSAQMVHQLLLRQVENPNTNGMWFSVRDKTIRFSMQEFCVVTCLDCSTYQGVGVHTKVEGPKFATKDGYAFPRINSWWCTIAPDQKKLYGWTLFWNSHRKRNNKIIYGISSVPRLVRLITKSYHEVVTEANNGRSPVEAALDQKAEIPSLTLIDQHRNDGPPSSSLDDGEAFFTKLD
ncbi:hypothetical protein EZV62_005350 [Acer yangbiense]|uniref:DUF1985 domain-containing protein n=1 Tax=Acer yangbiense TaxID=1000413 RepID=A0A5C7IMK8_9ROSI|nr:hypothetical protein EZV62_005350 [Acer yangbiense]